MQTITFYSYKGGTGRSLALANAAVYLAKFGFKVVALDLDLEAPGLHYKLSRDDHGQPLPSKQGVVDYIDLFLREGGVVTPIKDFIVEAPIPGVEKAIVSLMPAGHVSSNTYWSKLSHINWQDLFYRQEGKGVQIFKELQTRISDELDPDFLLIDSRTGITEMGGVATTLLADKVLCLVLPTMENLEGSRAVLRSLNRSRREITGKELDIILAVSRLPETGHGEDERNLTDHILSVINKPAEDAKDSLKCHSLFVLHSEAALQIRETLRVGSDTNPDDSILLRDYLRLFATFLPKQSIEPKVKDLIDKAWAMLRTDPDAALKDMEVLTESFPHPENYRELLRFYRARNAEPVSILMRAQRLWEITRDSKDSYLWEVVARYFDPRPTTPRKEKQWSPDLSFIRSIWRDAGKRDPAFGIKLAEAYSIIDEDSVAADVLSELMSASGPTPSLVARNIHMLGFAQRREDADALIRKFREQFGAEAEFAAAWARHALRSRDQSALLELVNSPALEKLRPSLGVLVLLNAGLRDRAVALADPALKDVRMREATRRDLDELGRFFADIDRWDEFEKLVSEVYPRETLQDLKERMGLRTGARRLAPALPPLP
jgi:MinD-like ATPase involved in chromosome partitioning or flagellar assembly